MACSIHSRSLFSLLPPPHPSGVATDAQDWFTGESLI
jgi:hypothetical protein